jgi:hypothetical protein
MTIFSGVGLRWLSGAWLGLISALVLTSCAAAPAPVVDNDLEAFTQGIDSMLKTGMTLKEARAVLKERMPPPSMKTDGPVAGGNRSKLRRVMIGWPTTTSGTTLVVTIFLDQDGRIVRWTTGPVTE